MLEAFFRNIPPVIKNLLIINVLMFLAAAVLESKDVILLSTLGLYNFTSPLFEPFQIITYMFMHGNFTHLFFNMFSLFMFGAVLERVWGPKRFLTFYFITGIGSVVLFSLVGYIEYLDVISTISPADVDYVKENVARMYQGEISSFPISNVESETLARMMMTPVVGASGAIFGIMTAFGLLFPNTEMMLLFFPVPVKAKYFIPFMILLEFYLGVMQFSGDNVAHFAHIGGAVIGAILVIYWNKKNRSHFY